SELDTARETAAALKVDHHEMVLAQSDVARRVPALLAALDQPLADQAIVPLHAVAELARASVKVVIGGEGADELFAGYPRYRWFQLSQRLRRAAPSVALRSGARAIKWLDPAGRGERMASILQPQRMLERHLDWVTYGRRHVRHAVYGPALAEVTTADG